MMTRRTRFFFLFLSFFSLFFFEGKIEPSSYARIFFSALSFSSVPFAPLFPSFLFFLFLVFVVSTPGSRYYADVAGIRVPILSSVSLTSESSASVRSSKGKLQLGDVSPIERTQTNRTRIVIERSNVVGVQHLPSSTIRTLSSSPLFVEEDRPVFVSLYQRIEF